MTNSIPQAAIEAAAEGIYERAFRQELPEAPIDLARAALEAAMPHIRKQVAEEIIAKQASHDSTLRVSPPHFEYGFNTGMKYAARIAEGDQ